MDSSMPASSNPIAEEELSSEEDAHTQPPPTSGSKRKKLWSKSKRKSFTRSKVWEHFTQTTENKDRCKCNYCGKVYCCATTSGTSSLKKHLEKCKEHDSWQKSKAGTQHVLEPEGADGNLRLAKISEDEFRAACNEMLVLGELPLSFIESLALRHFCTRMKLYRPHSRRSATRDIVEMFVLRKLAMKKMLVANKQRVSLTTDIWVAPTTGASYMVITAHFVDVSRNLRKLIIGFKHVSDHRGATIYDVLLECLLEWGLEKIFTITVDATANTFALKKFKDAIKLVRNDALLLGGEFMHLRCSAHILNLVVKDGLQDVESSVCAIRNVVQYVRSSSARVKSFELRVETGKMTRGSLSLDCKTRWNSTYLMLSRTLKFRLAFDKMESEDKLYNDYFQEKVDGKQRIGPPTKKDWDAIARLVRFLKIFYNSTLVVSASSCVNSHKCYNEIVAIHSNLMLLSKSNDEELKKKANAMILKFDKYWDGLKDMNRLLIIASVFDPQNKMKFATLCFDMLYGKDSAQSKELYDSVTDVLKRFFDEYASVVPNAVSGTSQSCGTSLSGNEQESQDHLSGHIVEMDLDNEEEYVRPNFLYKALVKEIGNQEASNELEMYLKEKVENPPTSLAGIEYDVLSWWKHNSSKYPIMSEIARDVFAMQVSSVASESAFSTSGRILDPYKSCLTHYMIEVLMCTEQWMKCDINLTEKGAVTNAQMLADIELQDNLEKEFESKQNFQP